MPNIEELVDTIGQLISEKKQGEVYFTTMDLTYAYGQLPLSEETSVHCNFSLVGGRSTGTYRFRTGFFYGLTSMPAEFQRVMDSILNEFPQANAFIDDILVTTKGTEVQHISLVEKILRKLNHENISLKLPKCEFAKRECEWLGDRITETGVTPLKRKTSPIDALKAPKTVTQLKSFMGSIHSLHKYLPAIAEMSAPLRPLLSKKNEYNWTAECECAFQNIKMGEANIVELKHFDIHKDIRVVCDASHNGLGAVLEQLGTEGWRPISFASRFLNAAEKKYSTNELEMLAVVWGAEYFRNYILGRSFTVITDHKVLISLLNGNNKKNETLFSRLTRWLDRLIPFDFVIEHKPGAKIGLADYLSRYPSEPPKPISQYDNLFTVAKIASIRKSLGFTNELKPLGKRNYQNIRETGSKQSRRFSSNHKRERITCIQPATVEGGKSCVKTTTNRKRSICITRKSNKSKGHSVCSIYCSLGRRLNLPTPGAKIGLADYLSRYPSEPPKPISQYDNLFTVAKIASIRKSLGFTNELKPLGKRNYQNIRETGSKQSRRFSSNHKRERITCIQPATVEGGKSCVKTTTNRKRSICITRKSNKSKGHSVCSIYCSLGRRLNLPTSKHSNKMDSDSNCSFPVFEIENVENDTIDSQTNNPNILQPQINSPLRLDENLLSSDEITVINPEIVAITKNTRDSKINTVLSIPSKFPGELFPTVNPNQQIMSIIPRDCKVIKKSQSLPELFSLEFVASNIPADVNLVRVKEALEKKTNLKEELLKIGKYWAQYANDLSLRDDCVWLDGRLVIPLPLQVPVESRIHYYHHGKRNMFEAARDVWYPYMYRSLAAKATYCQQCTEAGKNLKPLLPKGDMGKVPEPREPNECLQLDFWGPINYLNESKKYVLVATDRFSRWPSAMVTTTNTSDKVLKFLNKYISHHGVPRKIHVDQGSCFTSNKFKSFCNEEGIELIYSPVNDHRGTGSVERTIGSLKNFVLTYATEKEHKSLESMIDKALGALRFSKNATTKLTPFEAHHGREANTVLRNLTKKPSLKNLNWKNVLKQKCLCLDETDPEMNKVAFPQHSNWEERSDLTYAPTLRRAPITLDSDQQMDACPREGSEVGPQIQGSGDTGPNIQGSGEGRTLYQRTTSKTLNRYKLLKSNVISESEHTLKLKNGSVLRKSAVASKPKPDLPKKRKPATLKDMLASAKKGAVVSPKSKRAKTTRTVQVATFESDSSDTEDNRPLNIPARLPVEMLARREAIAAGQGPSGSTTVMEGGTGAKAKSRVTRAKRGKGGQRKQANESQERPALVARECLVNSSQEEDVESGSQSESSGTRRSTRRRKPVDKMGGVMIETIQGAEQTGKNPGGEGK